MHSKEKRIMSYIEKKGKVVTAAVCLATCVPVGATAYAIGNSDVQSVKNGDMKTAISDIIEDIEGQSYFIKETPKQEKITAKRSEKKEGVKISKAASNKASHKDINAWEKEVSIESFSNDIESLINEVDTVNTESIVQQETTQQEAIIPQETVSDVNVSAPVYEETVNVNQDTGSTETNTEAGAVDTTVDSATNQTPIEDVDTPATNTGDSWEQPSVETEIPTEKEENITESPTVQLPENNQNNVGMANSYSDLNQRIADAAVNLVGVTDGMWCTQVVQQALANAGVQDAYQLWPDQYAGQYGYYTDTPEPGNLIYYYNGGRGVDHIAIYIGDGMAVHGNYGFNNGEMGDTVVASAYINGGAPQYIQVCR